MHQIFRIFLLSSFISMAVHASEVYPEELIGSWRMDAFILNGDVEPVDSEFYLQIVFNADGTASLVEHVGDIEPEEIQWHVNADGMLVMTGIGGESDCVLWYIEEGKLYLVLDDVLQIRLELLEDDSVAET